MGQSSSHNEYGLKWYKINKDDKRPAYEDEVECQAKVLKSYVEAQNQDV